MHGETRIEYSVITYFHDFSVRGSTRINCTPVLFTGTGTAKFTGFRVHVHQFAVQTGAPDKRASPDFMGLASFGLEIGVFCDFLYSVLLLNAILGLDCLGLALSRPQVHVCQRQAERPERGRLHSRGRPRAHSNGRFVLPLIHLIPD